MKKHFHTFVIASIVLASANQASAWPNIKIDIPGIKIPPVTEWKIGGDLGRTWEGNKEAIRLGGIGLALLGPFGLVLGISQGAKLDIQKRAAERLSERLQAEAERNQQRIKAAGERFPEVAESIVTSYSSTSEYLGQKNAPESAFNQLNDLYLDATWCLVEAAEANNQNMSFDCEDIFLQSTLDLKRSYR